MTQASTKPVGLLQAQQDANIVRHSAIVPSATVELCAFPDLQAETLTVTESASVISLGLSPLLEEAVGRVPHFQTPRFCQFGTLNFRPAGIPFEVQVSGGHYHTIRCRFSAERLRARGIDPADLNEAQLEACFNIHAPRIEDTMMRLADEVSDRATDSEVLIEALVTAIAVDLSRYLADARHRELSHRGGLAPRHLRRVLSRMNQPGAAPGVDELAALCGLSRFHFMRAFRSTVGDSPSAYAHKVLMARARTLLATNERPIGEIARELGYQTSAAFSAAFKRHCGRSPRAWRAGLR